MKATNKADLGCLLFDALDGVADWDLLPHKRIWDCRSNALQALEKLLDVCPDPERMRVCLLASHLLHPEATPEWAVRMLAKTASELLEISIETLEKARWRLVPIPVTDGATTCLRWLLAGAGKGLPLLSPWRSYAFAEDSLAALETVSGLLRQRVGASCMFLPLGSSVVKGPSLGLPCYLGAFAAAHDLVLPTLLATGELDENGRVLPVRCVFEKSSCAGDAFQTFVHPADLTIARSGLESVGVAHVGEAESLVRYHQCDQAQQIVLMHRMLDNNDFTGLATAMCGLTGAMKTWVSDNRERIVERLFLDPCIDSLVRQVEFWRDSTRRQEIGLGNAVLRCLTLDLVRHISARSPRIAWDICVMQMGRVNHSGQLNEFTDWKKEAEALRHNVVLNEDADRLLAIYYVMAIIGDSHNRYSWRISLPEDKDAMSAILDMEKNFVERCSRYGPCTHPVLGKYYGTLGQNYAFCGPLHIITTENFLQKAIDCYFSPTDEHRKDQDRDRLYIVFALTEAGRFSESENVLRTIEGMWTGDSWDVAKMNHYQLHALLRIHVDAGKAMDGSLWSAIHAAWQRDEHPENHPGQLIAYNLGLLAENPDTARTMLLSAVYLCGRDDAGPTIQVMALLPLAAMRRCGLDLPENTSDVVEDIRRLIQESELDTGHFTLVLRASDWEQALDATAENEKILFPFNYR
jgi:hypothetical protein